MENERNLRLVEVDQVVSAEVGASSNIQLQEPEGATHYAAAIAHDGPGIASYCKCGIPGENHVDLSLAGSPEYLRAVAQAIAGVLNGSTLADVTSEGYRIQVVAITKDGGQ